MVKNIKRTKEIFQTEEEVDQVAKYYEAAYRGTGLTADEIWEEVIYDSLGDMNIFAKSSSWAKAAKHMGMTIEAVQQAVAKTKTEATNLEAEAEGKASRGLKENIRKKKVPPTDEFATYAMIWAHSDETFIGEEKFFIEMGSGCFLKKQTMASLNLEPIQKSIKI